MFGPRLAERLVGHPDADGADGFAVDVAEELVGQRPRQRLVGCGAGLVGVGAGGVVGEDIEGRFRLLKPLAQRRTRRQVGRFAEVEAGQQERRREQRRILRRCELLVKLVLDIGGRRELIEHVGQRRLGRLRAAHHFGSAPTPVHMEKSRPASSCRRQPAPIFSSFAEPRQAAPSRGRSANDAR